jgi:L-ascorbate metabolism protein UlaG (beta-lactamase superfamily)
LQEEPEGTFGYGARALGFLLQGSCDVYFAGDTDVFPGMATLSRELDVALLPVGGWGPRVPAGHLDPAGAAAALELLRPRIAIPIHWGTLRPFYRRTPYPHDERAGSRLAELAPDVDVRVLRPGERTEVEPRFIRIG